MASLSWKRCIMIVNRSFMNLSFRIGGPSAHHARVETTTISPRLEDSMHDFSFCYRSSCNCESIRISFLFFEKQGEGEDIRTVCSSSRKGSGRPC